MDEGTYSATTADDISGLIRPELADRGIRNLVETEEISLAYDKYIFRARKKKSGSEWLTEGFVREVHKNMFESIWDWAGKFRRVDLNIGIHWHEIPEQIGQLCGDFAFWDSPKSKMPVVEIAARLQSRLTMIHPFQNGNGRHARLMTDIFFHSRGGPLPSWPQLQRMPEGDEIRQRYLQAMKYADKGDHEKLIFFIQECLRGTPR